MTEQQGILKTRQSHIWVRGEHDHFVEPAWCSMRLFDEETFSGTVDDPCCGFGTIVESARKHGLGVTAGDLVHRGYVSRTEDFFESFPDRLNIVCNPPFDVAPRFAQHAIKLAQRKVAMIFPAARLNAAHWIKGTPLRRVWLLSPRPSMPPGHVIAAGGKPGGGKTDYAWLVWERGYTGSPELRWLHRDR